MVVVSALLLMVRLGALAIPPRVVFWLVLVMLLLPSALWAAWVDERLTDGAESPLGRRREPQWLRLLLAGYLLALFSPLLMVIGAIRAYDALPVPVVMWIICWHMLMGAVGGGAGGGLVWAMGVAAVAVGAAATQARTNRRDRAQRWGRR